MDTDFFALRSQDGRAHQLLEHREVRKPVGTSEIARFEIASHCSLENAVELFHLSYNLCITYWKRFSAAFQLMTFQMALKYSALRFW